MTKEWCRSCQVSIRGTGIFWACHIQVVALRWRSRLRSHKLLLVLLQSLDQGLVHDWDSIDIDGLAYIRSDLTMVGVLQRYRRTTRNLTV